MNHPNGFLIVDKPARTTSREVVNHIQRLLPRSTKIGHTGTLDPLATGVLVLCIGHATKLAEQVQNMGKCYRTQILLGFSSSTDDADGTITPMPAGEVPTEAAIRELLPQFTGLIEQLPPTVSALKIDGKRAYDLARRGREVKLEARPVLVESIQLVNYDWPLLELEIDCGKGTYIRSIARDLGQKLGCGGLVQTLRRTRVGLFRVENSISLDTSVAEVRAKLLPMNTIPES
jgi:tRNA pseudouridine55 synthase